MSLNLAANAKEVSSFIGDSVRSLEGVLFHFIKRRRWVQIEK